MDQFTANILSTTVCEISAHQQQLIFRLFKVIYAVKAIKSENYAKGELLE